MSDYEEVYSLFFTGLIVLFLFLTVYNIVSNFERVHTNLLTTNLLVSKALLESKIVSDELPITNASLTTALPIIILEDNVMRVGEVIIGE